MDKGQRPDGRWPLLVPVVIGKKFPRTEVAERPGVLPTASAVELRDEARTVLAALATVATAGFLAASTLLGTALAVGTALQNQVRPAPQHEVKAALQNQARISPWDLATLTAARKGPARAVGRG
jgi:hypothetical protein